jgi:pimeloyl-ACP methyl ester carboxylesterase
LGTTQAWRGSLPALVEAGFRAAAYDRWGYGRSSPRPNLSVPGFEDDLEDLRLLLDHLEFKRAALVGHSDGGTIALFFAARYPERVTRLVITAAHIYVEPKMIPGIENLRHVYETEPHFREGLARAHGENASSVFRNWYEGWVRHDNLDWDMRPILKSIRIPTLVIQGEADEHATPQHARDLAGALQESSLWLEPGAGHMLPQEQAQEFNRRVIQYLKSEV